MKKLILSSLIFLSGLLSVSFTKPSLHKMDSLTITILYDNYIYNKELASNWGFSCLIEGLDKTILFDTGNDDGLMLSNMDKLSKDPADVNIVILSHIHDDHTGGIMGFLEKNPDVKVYVPASFPSKFKEKVKQEGAEIIEVRESVRILDQVYSTGEMGSQIIEQSLVIQTGKGNIVITGCAHPGIDDIVEKSIGVAGDDILLVMGGFHLLRTKTSTIQAIIDKFKGWNVTYAAPTHCSGDGAIREFKNAYGDSFLELGVGRIIELKDL